jgi:hypothetical protein
MFNSFWGVSGMERLDNQALVDMGGWSAGVITS